MKKLILLNIAFLGLTTFLTADTWVKGYTKKNGTFVQGYFKSSKNHSMLDNFTTKGNYNPYTGKKGYKSPYKKYKNPYNLKYNK